MNASTNPSQSAGKLWVPVAAMLLGVGALWVLLIHRFSPESFHVEPMLPGTTETVWLLAGIGCALLVVLQQPNLLAMWPIAIASGIILLRAASHASIQMWDMLLFCVATGWTTWLEARPGKNWQAAVRIIVPAGVLGLTGFQFWKQVQLLNNLALGYPDCGENARLIFNTVTNPRELFLQVNPERLLFYDHVNVGILPFAPLWWVWPDLKLMIALQLVSVFGVVVPLYWIGWRVWRDEASAWLLVVAWMLFPSSSLFIWSGSYGFRWGNLGLLLYFIALALWLYERRGWALAMMVWAILIKEEAAIPAGMFGLYLALFERRRVTGFALAAGAFGYFWLATSVIIPLCTGEAYGMNRFYAALGSNKLEIMLSPLLRPGAFWGQLFAANSWYFGAALVAPLLLLPLRKPSILFIGALTFGFCCLSPLMKNITLHYQAAILPVVFFALVKATADWDALRRQRALTGIVACSFLMSLFLGAQPWSKETTPIRTQPGRLPLVKKFAAHIDPQTTLFASWRVAAQFVTQRYLYVSGPIPASADYVLLDLRDSWRGTTGQLDSLRQLRQTQREAEANTNLHLAAVEDGLVLYSRTGAPLDARQVVERDALPAAKSHDLDLRHLRIAGLTLESSPAGKFDQLRVTTYATVPTPTNLDVAVRCVVHCGNDDFASDFQPFAQGIWPLSRCETNKFYVDQFLVLLPRGLASEVSSVNFDAVVLPP